MCLFLWTGYAQRREQEAREQQENLTAMEALNNLFVVTKQQQQQQQQQQSQLRPAETVSQPPTSVPVNHNHKEAGATPTSSSVSQSQAGAVAVQVHAAHFKIPSRPFFHTFLSIIMKFIME